MIEIYKLIDPTTKEIRYIGKANNSQKRLKSHIRDSRRRKTPVNCWIAKLQKERLAPLIEVIATISEEDWKEEEIRQIEKHKKQGCRLLNIALGGDEPFCSKEIRQSNGRKVARIIHDNPEKKKLWQKKHMRGVIKRSLQKRKAQEKK